MHMSDGLAASLLLPVFVNVALVFFILIKTGIGRTAAVRARTVRLRDIALDTRAWPEDLRKLSNNYDNQFQLPVLFYLVVGFALVTGKVDHAMIAMAWGFVATRYAHYYIHTGRNYVPNRFYIFVAGTIALVTMWIWFAVRLYWIG
ncbi:MAG TPA: MAPEG family protein [Rhizobiales bacterium]|nr:MAPEG family protein [Hyphomicrobiales bacterium]